MSADIKTGAFTRTNSFGPQGRDAVQPRFHMHAEQDHVASAKEGRPIYANQERVQFLMPGSPNQPVFFVNDEHRQRWPEQYQAFKRGEEMAVSGTPIDEWPILNRAMVLELKALSVFSVEQCAEMPDTALQKIGRGGYMLRERAKAYLDEGAKLATVEQLTRQNEIQAGRLSAQDNQIAELRDLVDKLSRQVTQAQDAPSPILTALPGMDNVIDRAHSLVATAGPAVSSLDAVAAPRKRGRPARAA